MLGINTNIASLNAQNQLNKSQSMANTAMQRLSSGLRINSAADDAAGLAISTRFQSQINGLNVAQRNANDAISLSQTAEGALGSVVNNLQRIRDLSVQSANATNSSSDRAAMQAEVKQLSSEIDRVANQTTFNGIKLLDGSFQSQAFQVGADAGQTITLDKISSAKTSQLGTYQGFQVSDHTLGTASNSTSTMSFTIPDGSSGTNTIALGSVATDAKAISDALNASGVQGLTASAGAATATGQTAAFTSGASGNTDTLTLNGIDITLTNSGNASTNVTNAVTAINNQSSVSGVTAVATGSGINLVAADGRNINAKFSTTTQGSGATNSAAADYGLNSSITSSASIVASGTLNIDYKAPAGITGNVDFTGLTGAGFSAPTAITSTGTALSNVDISTVAGANKAINAVDAALSTINSSRAQLGAVQNRFQNTISNIASTSQNLTAANGRITDADFAAETAKMSKAQVLQQAGISVLAQANARPQQVLTLLR